MAKTNDTRTTDLKVEMMLQINQKLWESGVISKEVYVQKSDAERHLHGVLATPCRRASDTSPP